MKQVEEYRQQTAVCREFACTAKTEEERHQILEMARIWDHLAEMREAASKEPKPNWDTKRRGV